MAEIDGLLANMTRRGARSALLESGQPTRVYFEAGEAQGAALAPDKLLAIVREIAPADVQPRLEQNGRFQFVHATPHGLFEIHVARHNERLRVEVVLQTPAPAQAQPPTRPTPAASTSSDSKRGWPPQLLPTPTPHGGAILSIALSPQGDALAASSEDGAIYIWGIAEGKRGATLRPPATAATLKGSSAAFCVAFSPDGRQVAGGVLGSLSIWNVRGGAGGFKTSVAGHNVTGAAFSPDGSSLALSTSVAGGEGRVEVWDLGKKKLSRLYAPRQSAQAAAISSDGRWLAVGDARGVGLSDLGAKSGALSSLQSMARGVKAQEWTATIEMGAPVVSLSFAQKGSGLAVCAGGQCALLDTSTQRVLWKQRESQMRAVAFAPDAKFIASASEDGQIYFFDWASGAPCHAPLRAGSTPVNALAFARDGKVLAAGSADGSLQLWRLP